jgi:hypothetical protein
MFNINLRRTLLILAVFVGVVSFLPQILETLNGDRSRQEDLENNEAEKSIVIKEPSYDKGEIVFNQLKYKTCEQLDLCWTAAGYAMNGDKVLKKEFPTIWGSKRILFLPKDEWFNLSDTDKKNLGDYLRHINVNEVYASEIRPAEFADGTANPDRNTLAMDEMVWSSSK